MSISKFKLAFTATALFASTVFSFASECVYDKNLTAEEFPIGVMLSWSTASESNTSLFEVEKSEDGIDFAMLGSIEAAGNSNNKKYYNFLDAQASAKKIYYRLKQIDIDGSFTYSDVLPFTKKMKNDMMIVNMSSESASKKFDFTLDAIQEGKATIKIVDVKGQVAYEGTRNVNNGLTNLSVDLQGLREGTYKLLVIMNGEEETFTIRRTLDEVERTTNMASDLKSTGKN